MSGRFVSSPESRSGIERLRAGVLRVLMTQETGRRSRHHDGSFAGRISVPVSRGGPRHGRRHRLSFAHRPAPSLGRTLEVNEEVAAPMGHFDRCLLLLVRSDNDIPRACREAREFLTFRDARFPKNREERDEQFVGIWVDPDMVDSPPELLGCSAASGHRAFRIRGSFGSSGIWLLCWVDPAPGSSSTDLAALREALALALVEQRTHDKNHITPQFAPIFE
jgi:hypothetical protein